MSLTVMKRVWEQSAQEGSALVLMLALANHANKDSVCWPKVSALAEEARLQPRQTQALLSRLEAAGEIEIRRNITGAHLASQYLVRAGDPSVQWPEELEFGRVQSSVGTGAEDCTGSPKRVHSSVKTGAATNTPTGAFQRGRVQSSVGTGAFQRHALKESEPSIEPSMDSLLTEIDGEERERLAEFLLLLSPLSGFLPSGSFVRKVREKYGDVDLVEEAIGIADWFGKPNKKLGGRSPKEAGEMMTTARVLRWLGKALGEAKEAERDHHGTTIGGPGERAREARGAGDAPVLRERDTIPRA